MKNSIVLNCVLHFLAGFFIMLIFEFIISKIANTQVDVKHLVFMATFYAFGRYDLLIEIKRKQSNNYQDYL